MPGPAIDFTKYAKQQQGPIDFSKYSAANTGPSPTDMANQALAGSGITVAPPPSPNTAPPDSSIQRDLEGQPNSSGPRTPSQAFGDALRSSLHAPGNMIAQAPGAISELWDSIKNPQNHPVRSPKDTLRSALASMNPVPPAQPGEGTAQRVTGTVGNIAGGALLGKATEGLGEASEPRSAAPEPPAATPPQRGIFAKRMAQAPEGSQFTRGELFDAAQQHGVNLDLAQATEHPVPSAAKKVVQYTLGGSSPMKSAQEANMGALNEWGNKYLDSLSHNAGEAAGSRIQDILGNDLAEKKAAAGSQFKDLDQRVGSNTVKPANTAATARQIKSEFNDYYKSHPELVPAKAWKIVNDLAASDRPAKEPAPDKWTDANGVDHVEPAKTAPARGMNWADLHNLRSDLMELYRRDPEVIKDRSGGWLKQMVGAIDSDMTSAASGLSPEDRAQFRVANEIWENDIKGTYDNPQHPLYHALRTPFASATSDMLAAKRPELARQINGILGRNAGDFQRYVTEKILQPDNAGGFDYKGMPGRLKKFSPEYLQSLLGPERTAELYKMARIGSTVAADANPSGTAKTGIPAAEAGFIGASALHGNLLPAAAVPVEYGTAKAITSPRLTRRLVGAPKPGQIAARMKKP